MKKETVKLTKSAMQFVDANCFAAVKSSEDKKPSLSMLAYSGGIIKDHWWWGDLAIDVSGIKMAKDKTPILEDHSTSKKIGVATKFSKENNQLSVVDSFFLETAESLAFQANSAAGFPYEASIYAKPTIIETVGDGIVVDVNGYKFTGPGTIWRQCILKEASICTFGYDPNTKSAAMSEAEEEFAVEYVNEEEEGSKSPNKEELTSMKVTAEQFKEGSPEAYEALVASITAGVEQKFAVEKTELETKLSAAQTENTKLSAEVSENTKRLVALEKNDLIRQEQAIKLTADSIFNKQFSATEIREDLSPKIRKLVNHNQFVENGVLDAEKFQAAVDAELADWKTSEVSPSVMGFSPSGKELSTDAKTKLSAETDAVSDRMLAHLGMGKKD